MSTVDELTVSAYTVPTDQPEADGTLAWTQTTLVLAEASGNGTTGLGWTYGPAAAGSIITDLLAPAVVGGDLLDVPAAHEAMCRAVRNAGRPGLCSMAISAVDCALWDLKARCLELPLHRLLGQARTTVPIYGSGGFTSYDDARLCAQLDHWTDAGIPRVKIKIGESWGGDEARDLARLDLARKIIGPDSALYADANGGYSVKQAIRVGQTVDIDWFEEPVSSDDRRGLRQVADAVPAEVAAGEYGYDLPYFAALLPSVDCLQADVTRCGGVTEFLRVAALARAAGRELSAHCCPAQHVAVMAAIPDARHIEWFHDHVRIERLFFDGVPDQHQGALTPPEHPYEIRRADIAEFRVA